MTNQSTAPGDFFKICIEPFENQLGRATVHKLSTGEVWDASCKLLGDYEPLAGMAQRTKHHVRCRYLVAYALYKLRAMSYPEVSKAFGKSYHSSAYTWVKNAERLETELDLECWLWRVEREILSKRPVPDDPKMSLTWAEQLQMLPELPA